MNKFFILVKKEIRELLTPQFLAPLLITVLIFVFIGKVVGRETQKTQAPVSIAVADLDSSASSRFLLLALQKNNFQVSLVNTADENQLIATAKAKKIKAAILIPKGFEAELQAARPAVLKNFSILTNFSFFGARAVQKAAGVLAQVGAALSQKLIAEKVPRADPQAILAPLKAENVVVIGAKSAAVDPAAVIGFINTQTTLIPIILFLVITLSSQLIALSMATEKENKTLETLLSAPVGRNTIVAAKLVGAGLVSLLTTVVYIFGFRYYFNGLTGFNSQSALSPAVARQLGLVFSAGDYALLGIVLFLAILVALAIAIILGAFAEDAKGVQAVVTPLMVLVLIPYLLVLFFDLSEVSLGLKILIYAIPFSHAFLAAPNILLGEYRPVFYGGLYMAVIFLVFVVIAAKLFASEKILTLKFRFRKKI